MSGYQQLRGLTFAEVARNVGAFQRWLHENGSMHALREGRHWLQTGGTRYMGAEDSRPDTDGPGGTVAPSNADGERAIPVSAGMVMAQKRHPRPACRRCGWPLDIDFDPDGKVYHWRCNRPWVWRGDRDLEAFHARLGELAPPWDNSKPEETRVDTLREGEQP